MLTTGGCLAEFSPLQVKISCDHHSLPRKLGWPVFTPAREAVLGVIFFF
jgi:hypothetical protein